MYAGRSRLREPRVQLALLLIYARELTAAGLPCLAPRGRG
jgi:hypothetical protein